MGNHGAHSPARKEEAVMPRPWETRTSVDEEAMVESCVEDNVVVTVWSELWPG